jgi:hypothetical protein
MRLVVLASLMVSLLCLPQSASAALLDAPWTGSGPAGSTVTVSSNGTTASPKLDYSRSGNAGTWTFSAVAAKTRSLPIAWQSSGFYSFFQVRAQLVRFIVRNNVEVLTETLYSTGPEDCGACNPPSGGFNYSGTTTFDLQAGDTYGFRVGGSHQDGTNAIQGTLLLKEVDATPPVVTPELTGTQGTNGFYTGDVTVHWNVVDDGSLLLSKTGCADAKVSADTAGTDVTCTATSRGGETTRTVTIKRDTTAPDLTVPTVVVQQATDAGGAAVNFTTGATDALDSAPVLACTPASGTVFVVGMTKTNCTATDAAGNQATKSFDVIVLAPIPIAQPAAQQPVVVTPQPSNAVLSYQYAVKGKKTKLAQLKLRKVETGATVTVGCTGPKCPKALTGAGKVVRVKTPVLSLASFAKTRFFSGSKLVVTITGTNLVKTIKTVTMRTGKAPRLKTTCLSAGAVRPTAC